MLGMAVRLLRLCSLRLWRSGVYSAASGRDGFPVGKPVEEQTVEPGGSWGTGRKRMSLDLGKVIE